MSPRASRIGYAATEFVTNLTSPIEYSMTTIKPHTMAEFLNINCQFLRMLTARVKRLPRRKELSLIKIP